MKKFIVLGVVLLPVIACAAAPNDCKVVEFSDHFEVVCEGDGKILADQSKPALPSAKPVGEQRPDPTLTSVRPPAPEPAKDGFSPDATSAANTSQPSGSGTVQRNRQGRPNSADRDAAIEARKTLIKEQRPKE